MFLRPTARTLTRRAGTAAMVLALLAGGCNVSRINHLHTPANQTRAENARDLANAVFSDRDGLLAKTMANLEAEQNMRRAVALASDEFSDLADIESLGAMDWDWLREHTYDSLGASQRTTARADFGQLAFIVAHRGDYDPQHVRDAAALLHLGTRLLAEYSGRLDELDSVWMRYISSNTVALLQLSGADSRVDRDFARAAETFEAALGEITLGNVSRRIADAYEQSLVGVSGRPLLDPDVGGGDRARAFLKAWAELDRSGFDAALRRRNDALVRVLVLYDTLVKGERARAATLVAEQARIRERAKTDFHDQSPGAPCDSEGAAASTAVPTASGGASELLELLDTLRTGIRNVWEDEQMRQTYLERASQVQRELLAVATESLDPASVYSLVPLLGEGLGDEELSSFEGYLSLLQAKVAALPDENADEPEVGEARDAASRAVKARNEFRAALNTLRTTFQLGTADSNEEPDSIIRDKLEMVIRSTEALNLDLAAADLDRAKELAAELEAPIRDLVNSARSGTVSLADARSLLNLAIGTDRSGRLADALKPTDDLVKHMRSLLTDVSNQNAEASARVVEFLVGLHSLRQNVHEENARHYLVLTTIAKAEIERWLSVGAYAEELEGIYADAPTDPNSLFDAPAAPLAGAALARPCVTTSTPVIHTLRLLAEEAQTRHSASPAADAGGRAAAQSAARLTNAVRAISIQQLLSATNRRAANRNSIALLGEVREHSARLDDIGTTGVELEIRYHMDELVAFHSTGLTDQNLQNLVGAVQQGILIWIGSEQ